VRNKLIHLYSKAKGRTAIVPCLAARKNCVYKKGIREWRKHMLEFKTSDKPFFTISLYFS